MAAKSLTFSKFTGDRECKSADVLRDGARVGCIVSENRNDFESRGSFRRVWKFESVQAYTLDGALDVTFWAVDGHTHATAMKAAKDAIRKWAAVV